MATTNTLLQGLLSSSRVDSNEIVVVLCSVSLKVGRDRQQGVPFHVDPYNTNLSNLIWEFHLGDPFQFDFLGFQDPFAVGASMRLVHSTLISDVSVTSVD